MNQPRFAFIQTPFWIAGSTEKKQKRERCAFLELKRPFQINLFFIKKGPPVGMVPFLCFELTFQKYVTLTLKIMTKNIYFNKILMS